jgi:hypothetical protein
MTAAVKMRTLAQQDATLQTYFGDAGGIFRWFDKQLQPGYLKVGKACVRVRRISTLRQSTHETATRRSQSALAQPRFQIDVLDYESERARSAAKAITDWFATVDFSSDSQFASPPTSPKRHPNVVLNEREDLEYSVQPPAHVVTLDVRIFDLEE